jgi:hypothetical protein
VPCFQNGCMDPIFIFPTWRIFYELQLFQHFPEIMQFHGEGATISLLSKFMHFLQKVQLCFSCLIEKGLEGLWMTKDSNMYMTLNGCSRRGHQSWYIFTKRWSAPVLCEYPGLVPVPGTRNLGRTPELDKNPNRKYLFFN